MLAAPDGHAGALVEGEAPVAGRLPAREDVALAGAGDVVEHDDRGAGHQALLEPRQRRRSAQPVTGVARGRTVDKQQVHVVGELDEPRRRVPRRLALQRRVEHARDGVQRSRRSLLVHERGPAAVVLVREEAARAAFAQQPHEHHRAHAAAALDDPRAGAVDDLVADRDQARGAHRTVVQRS